MLRKSGFNKSKEGASPPLGFSRLNSCILFSPSQYYIGTMASADFCRFNRTSLHGLLLWEIHPSCQDRWRIETFFRDLKQNLKIKTFMGTSANAVKIQIWTALLAMLILRFLQLRSKFGWSLSNLVALLRMNLFTHRDFWAWLDQPFEVLPIPYDTEQLQFTFT